MVLGVGLCNLNSLKLQKNIQFPTRMILLQQNKKIRESEKKCQPRKRELKKRRKNEYRCDERLKTKVEESTSLACTGLHEELEHLKIKTRLIRAKLANVMGEYVI